MSDLKQNDDGDLVFVNQELVFVAGADEVRQRTIQRLRTIRGEWFLDLTVGVPWFQEVLVKNPIKENIAAILQVEILETPGVIELLQFDVDYEERTLFATFKQKVYTGDIQDIATGVGI